MHKGIKIFKKCLLSIVMITMILSHVGMSTISAESHIADEGAGVPIAEINYDDFSNDLVLENHDGILVGEDAVGNDMGSDPYTAYFSLDYYGTRLIAVATAQLESKSPYDGKTDDSTKVYIDDDDLLRVKWYHQTAKVNWSISLYEATGETGYEYDASKPYLKYFLVGFFDPDESNYLFNPDGRTIYYDDKSSKNDATTKTAAQFFQIVPGVNGGLIKDNNDPRIDFDAATFVVSILNNETSFSFKTDTLDQGSLQVPRLYSRNYNITYDFNDTEGPKSTIEKGNPDSYASSPNVVELSKDPSRVGYTFLGWNNETDNPTAEGQLPATYKRTIDADATGDKNFKAYWEPVKYDVLFDPNPKSAKDDAEATGETADMLELTFNSDYSLTKNGYQIPGYKFMGWSLNEGKDEVVYSDEQGFKNLVNYLESGDVDLENPVKLYAQWEPIQYKIQFDPNEPQGTTSEGVMNDQEPLYYDEQYNLNTNKYTIKEHDFLGWSTEEGVHDVVYNDEQDFINLTQEDGGVVTLYAQWRPWNYYISYDANGGYGDMPRQTFTSRDETMRSSQNQFNRDGYQFMGFEFVYKNTKYHTATTEDLHDMLKSLGRDSEITLVAQWAKLPTPAPEPEIKRYSLPVTGVDR